MEMTIEYLILKIQDFSKILMRSHAVNNIQSSILNNQC